MRIGTSKKWRVFFNEFAQLPDINEKKAWLKATVAHCNQHLGIKSKQRYLVKANQDIFNMVEGVLKRLFTVITFHRYFLFDQKMSQDQVVKYLQSIDFQIDELDRCKKELKASKKQIIRQLKRAGVKFKAKTKSQNET